MPCPIPLFWRGFYGSGDILSEGAGWKWAPQTGCGPGHPQHTPGPFPDGSMGWWRKATPCPGDQPWHRGCPRVPWLWGGEAGAILGLIHSREGQRGWAAAGTVTAGVVRGCRRHEAAGDGAVQGANQHRETSPGGWGTQLGRERGVLGGNF